MMSGSTNTSVLPDPVKAMPMMSRPCSLQTNRIANQRLHFVSQVFFFISNIKAPVPAQDSEALTNVSKKINK